MPLIDLTHPINANMPVYPGTDSPDITQACTVDQEGFAEKVIRFYSHTGTHIDAPSHLIANGRDLDSFPIETFRGPGLCLDCSTSKDQEIGLNALTPLSESIADVDFLLLHTGWGHRWGSSTYFEQHPVLSHDAARWLTQFSLKAVGLDNISADLFGTKDYPVHRVLLESSILIIENMAHLDQLPQKSFGLTCLPLKLAKADGAPVRVLAEF